MKSLARERRGRSVDRAREDRAAGRLVDPAELLDRLRGERDLVAAERAPAGGGEPPVHRVLHDVGLVERGRRQLAPQALEARPPLVRLEDVVRDALRSRLIGHAALPYAPSCRSYAGPSQSSTSASVATESTLESRIADALSACPAS